MEDKETGKRIREFLFKVSNKSEEMLKICERGKFVFNDTNDRWQKLAFTFYSEIAQLSNEALKLL